MSPLTSCCLLRPFAPPDDGDRSLGMTLRLSSRPRNLGQLLVPPLRHGVGVYAIGGRLSPSLTHAVWVLKNGGLTRWTRS